MVGADEAMLEWQLIAKRIQSGLGGFTVLREGLGKLSHKSCLDAGMTANEAVAVHTLYDILVAVAETEAPRSPNTLARQLVDKGQVE